MVLQERPQDFWGQQIFIAFDTETTGVWSPINRIVELAAVKFSLKDGIIDTTESLVNPGTPIPEEVTEIHGITDQMVKNAPRVKPVLEKFIHFCGDQSILIAHNSPFDISFVGCELDRSKLAFGENLILDTVDIFRRFFPGLESYSLLNLVKHFGISQGQDHRALSDSMFVYELFKIAVEKLPTVKMPDDLEKSMAVYKMSQWRTETTELPDNYSDLTYAIKAEMRVEIDYHHPVKPPSLRIIHPRHVYRLGSTYYISAYCELVGAERTFRLDRIASYKVLAS